MTPAQRDLLRRLTEREKSDLLCRADDVKALLSLCAELGGAKDRAEWKFRHGWPFSKLHFAKCSDNRHAWTPEQWAAEWRKREGL